MATLSPPLSLPSRPQSLVDARARPSISRPSSPSPQAGESATTIAWRNALNSYRKSLSDKDFKRIMIPVGPEDVANEVEKWLCRQSASRHSQVAAAVRAGVGRMQRFSASIDMLAQGSPSPGCLLWGSIKFVLTIVQAAAEEYDKLCHALSRMVDCLPQIELYTETFLDSEMVKASVSSFYVSTLRFWTRACKFYRRHRLLNFIRVIWNDFDVEFSELEVNMIENRDRVERAALAEHIGQSKVARVHQQSVNHKLLDVQQSVREKEITAWLAPTAYDVNYYQNDLANARALRHPKTCQWIFEKEEMGHLLGDAPNVPGDRAHEESILWIYAKPGAGKTVLSSRLIDHCTCEDGMFQREHVFYFFCKSTDADKNNATAVIRSLLYQLYNSTKDPGTQIRLIADIEHALDKSGKRQAVDFAPIWGTFADYIKCIAPALIVLDALDECQDSEQLIQGLISISSSELIKVIVTSRREAHLFAQLGSCRSLEITAEDIGSDIVAYVEAKVLGSPRLSHTLVRDLVISRLSTGHSGMFLWVYLMLKELKSCFSVTQVQGVLANLPQGLDGIYESVLQRLRKNLSAASLDLCYKVLTWVISAIRPLRLDELKHALSLHHEIEGDTLLFEYAEKDIELICGSLVTVRQGTLQVIHLTVKEYLTSTHGSKYSTHSDLLIDPAKATLYLTLACLKCISVNCNKSIVNLDPRIARLDTHVDVEAVVQRRRQAPLMEYASLTWMTHLAECDGSQIIGLSKAFEETFNSRATFYWIEACMAFQPDSVLRLLAGLEEVMNHISRLAPEHWPESEASCVFFADWCQALRNVFEEHGSTLSHRPWEVYCLDLQNSFSRVRQLYRNFGDTYRRDTTLRIEGYESLRSCRPKAQAHSQLQQDVQGYSSNNVIFFIHDERRRLYFWGEKYIDLSNVRLFVQNATTGQRMPPAVKFDGDADREGVLQSYGLSPSGQYIVLVYCTKAKNARFSGEYKWILTLIWQISEEMGFTRRVHSEPWARVIFSYQCENGPFKRLWTTTSIVFLDGGYCLTPCGEIHLPSRSRRPLLDRLSNRSVPDENYVLGSFYSQNGKYLFISELAMKPKGEYRAKRVALLTDIPEHLCSWKEPSRQLVDVSPSGRFLVLSTASDSIHTRGDDTLYLYDVNTSKTIQLPLVERLDYFEAKYQFAKDEMELIAFIPCRIHGITTMNVFVWRELQSNPLLSKYGQLKLNDTIDPLPIHVNNDEPSALMVLESRVIQRVEFCTKILFPDAPNVIDDYPCAISQISKDGVRWAELRYGQRKAQLQTTDMSSAEISIHRLDLELSPCNEPRSRVVSFSPDLWVFIVDAQFFSIVEGVEGLTSKSFTIEGLPELLVYFQTRLNPRYWCQLQCRISPCNSYVIFTCEGDSHQRETAPSTIYAFRIDLVSRSSTRLGLQLPKDLTYVSADFHPSQHLMLLSYCSSSEPDTQLLEGMPPLQIYIVELEGLEMKPISLAEDELLIKGLKEFWDRLRRLPKVMFSDSGTFVLMAFEGPWTSWALYVIHHQLDADPVTTRYFELPYDGCYSYNNLTPSGEYMIAPDVVDRTSYRLVSRKLLNNHHFKEVSDFTPQEQDDLSVHLDNFICYPSSLADSNRFLLLGSNDDEKMRLLIAPREGRALEIRSLPLTFNEAKQRLEAEWAKRQALKDKEIGERGTQDTTRE